MLLTELIASWKLVNSRGREMYIVTTITGKTVWVSKNNFDTNAEQITFKSLKKGDSVVANRDSSTNGTDGKPLYLKGASIVLKEDQNEFVGCGKQIIKKYSSLEVIDHLVSKGVTPTFSMS